MLGIDIEKVSRFEHLIENKPNLVRKFFKPYEWTYAQGKAKMAQTLTGIWCAKEAVVKAYTAIAKIDIIDVEIRHTKDGAPFVFTIFEEEVSDRVSIWISISHTKDYANAVAYVTLK